MSPIMAYTVKTTFGKLPIGATFERQVRAKDPADRRRRILVRWRGRKDTHGALAGFATCEDGGSWRSEHCWPVFVDVNDLRLLVAIAQSSKRMVADHADLLDA